MRKQELTGVLHSNSEQSPKFRLRDCDVLQFFVLSDHHWFGTEQEWGKNTSHIFVVGTKVAKVVRPDKRHARNQIGQIEDNASDIKYILQAMTGMEDRLSNIEASVGDQGTDRRI